MTKYISELITLGALMQSKTFETVEESVLEDFENRVEEILPEAHKIVSEADMLSLAHHASILSLEYEDYSRMLFDIIWESKFYPSEKLWRVEPFSDILQEIKRSMQTKGATYDLSSLYIPFSFGKYDVYDIREANKIINNVDHMDKFDIDNMIGNVSSHPIKEMLYPERFERRLISSMERENYSIDYYGADSFTLCDYIEKHSLKYLGEYFSEQLSNV